MCEGYSPEDLFLAAGLAAKREGHVDAIDKCIVEEAIKKYKISYDGYTEENFVPFDPTIKRVEALVRNTATGETFTCAKGAPQVILGLSANRPQVDQYITDKVNELARGGYRTIGVAKTNSKGEWLMQGLIPLFDPPREDTKETIKKA
jgi:H+-transporting ATPase